MNILMATVDANTRMGEETNARNVPGNISVATIEVDARMVEYETSCSSKCPIAFVQTDKRKAEETSSRNALSQEYTCTKASGASNEAASARRSALVCTANFGTHKQPWFASCAV